MSFYIGDAAVHNAPASNIRQQLEQEAAFLRKLFGQLFNQILLGIINAILRALGLGAFVGAFDQGVLELENQVRSLIKHPLDTVIGDAQSIVDNIANALGIPGVGHDVSVVLTALEHVPGSVISGITTIEQNILDAIANALGFAGTGHSVAQVQSYLTNLPASVVTGALTNATLAGADITGIINAAIVSGPLTAATIAGADITGAIDASLVSGLSGFEQQVLKALGTAYSGVTSIESTIQGLTTHPVITIEDTVQSWVQTAVSSVGAVIRDFF